MAHLKKEEIFSLTHFFIYTMAFLILWEWLRPIPLVTNTADIHVFVYFALFSAVLIYFQIPYWLTVPSLLIASLFSLHIIFYEGYFFSTEGGLETLRLFSSEVWFNLGLIFSRDFAYLTDPFRTFLLLLLLSLICYLLYFWIFHTRRIFFFLFSTVIYITVLDTFTAVDASAAIIRIVVIGFFMITLLHMLKIQDQEKAIGRRGTPFMSPAWMYTLIIMIGFAIMIGVAAPKPDPQWSDPVPAIRGIVLGEGSGPGTGVSRVGYGENDERLGGGFVQDDGPVFQAEAAEPVYWRGESKEEYTGHGWISEQNYDVTETIFEDNVEIPFFRESAGLEEEQVSIEMADGAEFSHFFYPGQFKSTNPNTLSHRVNGGEGAVGNLSFMADSQSGRIQAQAIDENSVELTQYDVIYDQPTFPIDTLRNVSEDDPEDIQDIYLQLPDELPDRVVELAEEIVAEHDNRYDQVTAVEQYFSENDFTYQTTDVPVPEEDEDYVDQFLFESQIGYCDNYSTSMAVLLRAVDIPTRWVKGFTAGEEIEEISEDRSLYEVKNSNAHSWVEVYFPEVGWVPFEPTQGFDNYAEFEEEETEIDLDVDESAEDEGSENNDQEDMNDLMDPLEGDTDELEEGASAINGEGSSRFPQLFTPKNIFISVVVGLLGIVMYQKQNHLQNYYFLIRYRLFGRNEKFTTAYQRLLWILKNEGLPRREGETLREYAERVDQSLGSQAMRKLTKNYEKLYYGSYEPDGDWDALKKDWEEIVKHLNA